MSGALHVKYVQMSRLWILKKKKKIDLYLQQIFELREWHDIVKGFFNPDAAAFRHYVKCKT